MTKLKWISAEIFTGNALKNAYLLSYHYGFIESVLGIDIETNLES